jgi:hypothetical protein
MFRPLILTLLCSALLVTTGCANKRLTQNDEFEQITLEKAAGFSGDAERALIEAEVRHEAAVAAGMDFYAPLHMEQINEALALARETELKGLQSDSIIASSKVITLLELAKLNKNKVELLLQPLLQQKLVLEELNTPAVLPTQFKDQLIEIENLITKIEQGATSIPASDINPVMSGLKVLELNTLLEIHWQPAKNTLVKAKRENANKNAPKSFTEAEQLVEQAEKDIRAQYSNRALVSERGFTALRASQHALYVARDAELLFRLTRQRSEEAVLKFESLLAQIGVTLKAEDIRHMALQDQATALAQYAETQASRLIAPLQKRITELEARFETPEATAIPPAIKTPKVVETFDATEASEIVETLAED